MFVNRKKKQKKRKVEIIEIDSDKESDVSVAKLFVPLQNPNLGMVCNRGLWRIVGDFEDGFIDDNDKLRKKIEEYEDKERDRSIGDEELLRCENNKLKEKIKEL